MITRRLALFRIAAGSAVAATAAAPVVLAAVQPKKLENPELLRLGSKLSKLDRITQERATRKAAARAIYEASAPPLPEALLVTPYSSDIADSERETDCEDNPLSYNRSLRRYHTAYAIRRALSTTDDSDPLNVEDSDYLEALLPVADEYECAIERALDQSRYRQCRGAHFRAASAVETVARRIAKIPAQTPEGITVKAMAYEAWGRCEIDFAKDKAAAVLGPGLAADICRVLSEGEEA